MSDTVKNPIDELRAEYAGLIDFLLLDRTTDRNIIWATAEQSQIPIDKKSLDMIEPRFIKTKERRFRRTKARAEVFTPPDVCRLQNDLIVEPWSDHPDQFIDATFLEIACGEAPYLVSRYNVVDGSTIAIDDRIGLLDRKLRIINQSVDDPIKWFSDARRAYQSIYGYEFQGDNLLIARANLLLTARDYFNARFETDPPFEIMKTVAEIISWNLWQFDGINETLPFDDNAIGLFNDCRIVDWQHSMIIKFPSMEPVKQYDEP